MSCWRVRVLLLLSALSNLQAVKDKSPPCSCLIVAIAGVPNGVYEFSDHFTAARPSYIRKSSPNDGGIRHGLLYYARHGTWALDATIQHGQNVLLKYTAQLGAFAKMRPEQLSGEWGVSSLGKPKGAPSRVDIKCAPCATAAYIADTARIAIRHIGSQVPISQVARVTPSTTVGPFVHPMIDRHSLLHAAVQTLHNRAESQKQIREEDEERQSCTSHSDCANSVSFDAFCDADKTCDQCKECEDPSDSFDDECPACGSLTSHLSGMREDSEFTAMGVKIKIKKTREERRETQFAKAAKAAKEKILEQTIQAQDAKILHAEKENLAVTRACKKQIVKTCLKDELLSDQYRHLHDDPHGGHKATSFQQQHAIRMEKLKFSAALKKSGQMCENCVREHRKQIGMGLITKSQCVVEQIDTFCLDSECGFCYGKPSQLEKTIEEEAGEETVNEQAGEGWALSQEKKDEIRSFATTVSQLKKWWSEPTPATTAPSQTPTQAPTKRPTSPTRSPTPLPTQTPTPNPTPAPPPKLIPTPPPTSAPTRPPPGAKACDKVSGCTCTKCCNTFISATAKRCQECIKEECTYAPTLVPSPAPTTSPSSNPSVYPTKVPTVVPTFAPTDTPTALPTPAPTQAPTPPPTFRPTTAPSASPTKAIELTREVIFFSGTFMLGMGPYLAPTGLGDNPRNLQPSYHACTLQCESLSTCQFGTYLLSGERAKECWLAAGNYIVKWRETQVLCGTPCKSFHVEKRVQMPATPVQGFGTRATLHMQVNHHTMQPLPSLPPSTGKPTSPPSQAPTGGHGFEDDDFAPATPTKKHSDPMWPPSPRPPSSRPTPWPTIGPTPPTTAPTLGFKVLTSLPGPCQALATEASEACTDLFGHAYECVQKCEARILARRAIAGPEAKQIEACPVQWRRVVRSNICWPHDCTHVMNYFCGDFVGRAVQGWDIRYGPTHPAYFDLCAVCVEHYAFIRVPPVQNYACWVKKMVSFCASKEKKGLPSGEKIYVFGKSSRLARPMQWKWDRGTSSYHADSSDALQQWETTELSSNPGIKRYKSAMRTGTLTEIPPRANIGAFNSIDKDKDGFVSIDELRKNMGLPKPTPGIDDEATRMIEAADTDGDGQVSYSEFNKLLMAKQNSIGHAWGK